MSIGRVGRSPLGFPYRSQLGVLTRPSGGVRLVLGMSMRGSGFEVRDGVLGTNFDPYIAFSSVPSAINAALMAEWKSLWADEVAALVAAKGYSATPVDTNSSGNSSSSEVYGSPSSFLQVIYCQDVGSTTVLGIATRDTALSALPDGYSDEGIEATAIWSRRGPAAWTLSPAIAANENGQAVLQTSVVNDSKIADEIAYSAEFGIPVDVYYYDVDALMSEPETPLVYRLELDPVDGVSQINEYTSTDTGITYYEVDSFVSGPFTPNQAFTVIDADADVRTQNQAVINSMTTQSAGTRVTVKGEASPAGLVSIMGA